MQLSRVLLASGLLCAQIGWAEIAVPSPSAVEESSAFRQITGEVLIRAEFNEVLIAVDEADEEGNVDGKLDHLFVFVTLEPVLPAFTLRDAWAEIEARPRSVRVVANTERRELTYVMHKTPRSPRALDKSYDFRENVWGVNLNGYSGPYLNSLSLENVAGRGADIVRMAEQKSEIFDPGSGTELEDFVQDPTASGGDTCKSLCSKTCALGSCSTACNFMGCAKCECVGSPAIFPNCTCYLK